MPQAPSRLRPISDVLSGLRRQWQRERRAFQGLDLPRVLEACLGPKAAEVGFGGMSPRGTLTLTVGSAALLAELDGFRRDELLAAVRSTPEGARVRTLRLVSVGGGDGR